MATDHITRHGPFRNLVELGQWSRGYLDEKLQDDDCELACVFWSAAVVCLRIHTPAAFDPSVQFLMSDVACVGPAGCSKRAWLRSRVPGLRIQQMQTHVWYSDFLCSFSETNVQD